MRSKTLGFLIILALAVLGGNAAAGGWSVATLEEMPARLEAGKPFEIVVSIRAHGQTLMDEGPTELIFHQGVGSEKLTFPTEHIRDGRRMAVVNLPAAGMWSWQVVTWGQDQPMPDVFVEEQGISHPPERETPIKGSVRFAPFALSLLLIGTALVMRTSPKKIRGFFLALGIASAFSGVLLAAFPAAADPGTGSPSAESILHQLPGEALFVAKGCVVCHNHDAVSPGFMGIKTSTGPDLTDISLPAEYLSTWLTDPKSLKPKTIMPNLNLDAVEIAALVTFLTR